MWFATVACVLFPAYFLVDVNYFIRCAFTIIYAKARKKISFLDPSTIYGFVITSDIDFLLTHMNNARFLRELDFARIDHGTRSGFMEETLRRGGSILLGSSFIRYRLPLPVFSRYKIVTNVIWWDEKNVYLSHKVITLKDNIVRAVIYARATCLKVNVHNIAEFLNPEIERPEEDSIAPDYKKWMETLQLSSQLMKAKIAGAGAIVGGGGDADVPLNAVVNDQCTFTTKTIVDDSCNGNGDDKATCKSSLIEQYSSKDNSILHQD